MKHVTLVAIEALMLIISSVNYNQSTIGSVLITKQKTFGHSIKNGKS
jgi:hypothetical protein